MRFCTLKVVVVVRVLVLAGMPAAGKTTIGRTVARVLGWQFLHVDTSECCRYADIERRQSCFLDKVANALSYAAASTRVGLLKGAVLDNSVFNVVAFTTALLRITRHTNLQSALDSALAWLQSSEDGAAALSNELNHAHTVVLRVLNWQVYVTRYKSKYENGDCVVDDMVLYYADAALSLLAERFKLKQIYTDAVERELIHLATQLEDQG